MGTIKTSDGYTITIGAYGDIRLCGVIDGEDIYIKDKNNGGYVYEEIGYKVDDAKLYQLVNGYTDNGDYIEYENSNWFEVDVISPDGKWIDLCYADNVLDDDMLNCFLDIETYFEYIDDIKTNG